jgi:general secretion pathway protein E
MSALPAAPITNFAGVPKYSRLLTVGNPPLVKLDPETAKHVVALDKGGTEAVLLVVDLDSKDPTQAFARHTAQGMAKAKLREANFQVTGHHWVTAAVFAEVLRNPGMATESSGSGEPLQLFRRLVSQSIRQGSSDLHIFFDRHRARVLCRMDGKLMPLRDANGGLYSCNAALDAVSAGFNNTRLGNSRSDYEPTKLADCIINHSEGADDCQIRFTSIPGRYGPKIAMRIQRDSDRTTQGDFASAGYAVSQQELWRSAQRSGKGMVLITGSVNSGKSTALQTFIETMPGREHDAIYTVEDPIERKIEGAHQIEVLRDPGDPGSTEERFAAIIRALLRGDMDAVMMGEVRDLLSANFFLQVAQSGHLAMGTLHAHFISSIAPRLTNQKIGLTREEFASPKVINLLVYQALVPALCPHCRVPARSLLRTDVDVRQKVNLLVQKFGLDAGLFFCRSLKGCIDCGGLGTRGRVIVAEMYRPDREWLNLTRAGDDQGAERHYRKQSDGNLTSDDMTGKTVFEHALARATRGEIDFLECEEFESFERYELLPVGGAR